MLCFKCAVPVWCKSVLTSALKMLWTTSALFYSARFTAHPGMIKGSFNICNGCVCVCLIVIQQMFEVKTSYFALSFNQKLAFKFPVASDCFHWMLLICFLYRKKANFSIFILASEFSMNQYREPGLAKENQFRMPPSFYSHSTDCLS